MTGAEIPLEALLQLQYPARHFALNRLGLRPLRATSGHVPRLRGRGMTFEEHRSYQPGDEPRFIDWRVSARTGQLHVKIFREEHERPVWLLLDRRSGMHFGSRLQFKSRLAAEACALLGWTAAHGRERVGGVVLDGGVHRSPVGSGVHGILPWLRTAASPPSAPQNNAEPSLQLALLHLRRTLRPGSLLVISSDFADLNADAESQLHEIARHCQLILLPTVDPLESAPPSSGRFPVRRDGSVRWIDFGQKPQRAAWCQHYARRAENLRSLAQSTRAILLPLHTSDPAVEQLAPALARA